MKSRSGEFLLFITEREMIRRRRALGEPWPWTKDKVLRQFSFTNVHRCYDRTTQALKAIYDAHRRAPDVELLYNCAMHRYFGTVQFAEAVGWQKTHDPRHLVLTARKLFASGQHVFTGAYMITNGGSTLKKEAHVAKTLGLLWKKAPQICEAARLHKSWKSAYDVLRTVTGFGGSGFMSKETLLDAQLTPLLEDAQDRDTWTPVGPGGRRGLNRVLGQPTHRRWNEDEAVEAVQKLHAQIILPWERWRVKENTQHPLDAPTLPLAVTDVQFQLCEFDKWERTKRGEGRPRKLYRLKKVA